MKINKTKGFTLIELMVVIAIISLLSSVVLAAVKDAREKSILSKAVVEMKSLQHAVELYRTANGVYPGVTSGVYTDDDSDSAALANVGPGTPAFNTFVQTYLIANKFISKVPHAPNYPNNCVDSASCAASGYVLGYGQVNPSPYAPSSFYCGNEKVKNYFIVLLANSKKINLPVLSYGLSGPTANYSGTIGGTLGNPPYAYCLAM